MQESAVVNYHRHSAERQAFHFDVDGVYGNLISPELVPEKVCVQDIRRDMSAVNFVSDSIVFKKHKTQVKEFTQTSNWETIYNRELQSLLSKTITAKEVIIFDHTVRIDTIESPRKPARNVHNDYSQKGAEQRLIDIVGKSQAAAFENGHYGFVNIWRPVAAAVTTSPLGFIRIDSMQAEDWMTIDLVYPDEVREILGVAANARHQWFYLSGMTPDEVAIFNTYDNRGLAHIGHSALDLEKNTATVTPRQSIESRAIVRY